MCVLAVNYSSSSTYSAKKAKEGFVNQHIPVPQLNANIEQFAKEIITNPYVTTKRPRPYRGAGGPGGYEDGSGGGGPGGGGGGGSGGGDSGYKPITGTGGARILSAADSVYSYYRERGFRYAYGAGHSASDSDGNLDCSAYVRRVLTAAIGWPASSSLTSGSFSGDAPLGGLFKYVGLSGNMQTLIKTGLVEPGDILSSPGRHVQIAGNRIEDSHMQIYTWGSTKQIDKNPGAVLSSSSTKVYRVYRYVG